MRKPVFLFGILAAFVVVSAGLFINTPSASAAYNSSYLISDRLFTDNTSMSVVDIQNFLNSKNSGLKGYHEVEDCGSSGGTHYYYYTTYYSCGVDSSAAKIIYDSAQAYQISPKAILATLQKEQSLVTNPNPTQPEINCAMGYNSCGGYNSFFLQVDNGAWQFRTYIELMSGRSWWGYSPSTYPCNDSKGGTPAHSNGGNREVGAIYYSTGLYPGRPVTFYDYNGDPYTTITLANSSTAALYCYTPHVYPGSPANYFSGSYWFVYYFEQWFGSVSSPCYNDNNLGGAATGQQVIANKYLYNQIDYLTLVLPNNTGSACAEAHTWNTGQQSWMAHAATNLLATDPATSRIITADLNGDGHDELVLVKYLNTGSGKIEIHVWDPTYLQWVAHEATSLPSRDPNIGQVMAIKMPGEKFTRLMYAQYINTVSGRVEVHIWNPGEQSWLTNIATNLPATDQNTGQIIAANPFGESFDRLAYVKYQNTGSGKVEVHIWNPGEQSWLTNIATNLPSISPSIGQVIAGNIYGEGRDRLMFVKYTATGSGRVEVHVWNPGQTSWYTNIPTNLAQF